MTDLTIPNNQRICQVPNCTRKHKGKGFCDTHYKQMERFGEIRPFKPQKAKPKKPCLVDGCSRKHHANGYCERHNRQMIKFGVIKGHPDKTYNRPNDYSFYGSCCYMTIYSRLGDLKTVAIVDASDYEKVQPYKWYLRGNGYIACNNPILKLSRFLMEPIPDNMVIDHVNGDLLDNRKTNLRITTQQLNMANLKKASCNTSGFKGVCFDKSRSKWVASVQCKYKHHHLGRFDSRIDAAKAYDKGAIKYFGEFARTNQDLGLL